MLQESKSEVTMNSSSLHNASFVLDRLDDVQDNGSTQVGRGHTCGRLDGFREQKVEIGYQPFRKAIHGCNG